MELHKGPQHVQLVLETAYEVAFLKFFWGGCINGKQKSLEIDILAREIYDFEHTFCCVLVNTDVERILQTEPRQILDGLGLGRREEKSLSLRGKIADDRVHLRGETHLQDSVGFV